MIKVKNMTEIKTIVPKISLQNKTKYIILQSLTFKHNNYEKTLTNNCSGICRHIA